MDKKKLTETDIITKFILPAVEQAGWDSMLQIRQEVKLRDGKVIVRGQLGVRKIVKSVAVFKYEKFNDTGQSKEQWNFRKYEWYPPF